MDNMRHATLQQAMNIQYGYPPYSPPIMPPMQCGCMPMPPATPPSNGGGNSTTSMKPYPTKDDFPAVGDEGVIYVDQSDDTIYYWKDGEYTPLESAGTEAGVNRYDSIEDFPAVGTSNTLYIDGDTHNIYYWDDGQYVKVLSGTGSGSSGCDSDDDDCDCCIWGDILNGGGAEDISPICPIEHTCCGSSSGANSGAELNKDNIIKGLGYTPASSADLEKEKAAREAIDKILSDKIEKCKCSGDNGDAAKALEAANQAKIKADKAEKAANDAKNIAQVADKHATQAQKLAEVAEDEADEAKVIANDAKNAVNKLKNDLDDVKKAIGNFNPDTLQTLEDKIDALEDKVAENDKKQDNLIAGLQQAIDEMQEALDIEVSSSTWKWLGSVKLAHDEHDIVVTDINDNDLNCRKIYASITIVGSDDNDTAQRLDIMLNKNDAKHRIATLNGAIPATAKARYTNLSAHVLNTGRLSGFVQSVTASPEANLMLQSLATRTAKNEEIDFGDAIRALYFVAGDIGHFGAGTRIDLYGIPYHE